MELPENAPMREYQSCINALETHHGWLEVDLVHNVFLMVEEVGELAKGVRKYERLFDEGKPEDKEAARENVGEEIVDVMNYLLAIANRLEIDVEDAFRKKNERNFQRTWGASDQRVTTEG